MEKKYLEQVYKIFQQSIDLKQEILTAGILKQLVEIAFVMADALSNGKKILLCGNGGSAADAQHLACELLIRLRPHVNRDSIPALTLATDISSITGCGNDYGFEEIFSRPLSGLGVEGDVVMGITTSGKSPNIIKAFQKAREMNIKTVGFLGGANAGEPALEWCDYAFVVPSSETGRVQECHITAGHALMEMIEDHLLSSNSIQLLKRA